jgi:hypothetical protein
VLTRTSQLTPHPESDSNDAMKAAADLPWGTSELWHCSDLVL